MDGRAFDSWVRTLPVQADRRWFVAAIAALAVRPHSVRGQSYLAGLGDPCVETEQCAQVAACGGPGPVVCTDNGYAEDGARNCCVGQGQGCGAHDHCCSGLLCLGSHAIDGCGAGQCLPRDAVGVVARGTACTESAQCMQDDGYAVCSEDGRCCSFEGSRCAFGLECCGALTCVKDDPSDIRWYSPGTCAFAG